MWTGVSQKRIATGKIELDNSTVKNSLLDFLRKEVIQPHLPIRLPCYDFTPVIESAFDGSSPLLSTIQTSATFHCVFTPWCILHSMAYSFFEYTRASLCCHAAHAYQGLGHRLRAFPTPMVWRAVCTRPGNVFTAAFWSAITSDSSFV